MVGRIIRLSLMAAMLAGCAPSAAPISTLSPTDTREAPKATVEIVMATDEPTATSTRTVTATYTPRPTIITSTPTKKGQRSISTPGKVTGRDSETLEVIGDLPGHISVSAVNEIRIDVVLSNGRRAPLGEKLTLNGGTKALALEILAVGGWSIEFLAEATATSRSTLKPTTVRSAPTIAVIQTKRPTAVIIPTVFRPPTDVPPTGNCDPAYPTVCIPSPPPDLDCKDIPYRKFTVLPPDPHGLDGRDGDGIGCES